MTKDKALKMALSAMETVRPYEVADYDPIEKAIKALRQALDQLPDDTKMIEPSEQDKVDRDVLMYGQGFMKDEKHIPLHEVFIDRGAWSDVPDATKWVDELRGDEDLDEPPNSTTNVVEPEIEEPLTLAEEREAQQQLETHLDAVYKRNNQAFLAQAQLGQSQSNQSQELFGKTERLESENKRLQELADYRLKLLTKMPSEWVGLTDDDIAELRRTGAHSVSDADFQTIEAKLKELNHA